MVKVENGFRAPEVINHGYGNDLVIDYDFPIGIGLWCCHNNAGPCFLIDPDRIRKVIRLGPESGNTASQKSTVSNKNKGVLLQSLVLYARSIYKPSGFWCAVIQRKQSVCVYGFYAHFVTFALEFLFKSTQIFGVVLDITINA